MGREGGTYLPLASHSLMDLSNEALAIKRPSGEKDVMLTCCCTGGYVHGLQKHVMNRKWP
jgi:hypothetical protein